MDKNWRSIIRGSRLLFACSIVGALIAGCGGGGGGGGDNPPASSISGTAAAGAPVIGYVSVRDSSANPQPVKANIPIEANGHYSVDVTGLTPPFAFAADGKVGGKRVILYSAATADDAGKTINITPFTDLIVRNIAATAVDTYFSNPANTANLTTAQLDAQRVALTNKLAPALQAMGVARGIDLLRATFNADSTGLDRFMDAVKVDTTNPKAVTITNILDAANQLVIDTTASKSSLTATGTLSTTGMSSSTASPLDDITATFKGFSSFFATGLPDPANPNLTALFSNTFMEDGKNSSAFLTDITSFSPLIGVKFTNVVVDSIDVTAGVAQVSFSVIAANGKDLSAAEGGMHWQMKRDAASGKWQLDGNQHIAYVWVRPYAHKGMCNPASSCSTNAPNLASTPDYQTGLWIDIGNYALQTVGSVVVTGPGLPASGVTLIPQNNGSYFGITTANPNPCNYQLNCNLNYWIMSDAEIALVKPNSVYTVALYDNSPTPQLLATYSNAIQAAPVLNTSLATISYPSLTGLVDLAGKGATTLTPSWKIPAGLDWGMLWIYAWQASTGATTDSVSVGQDLSSATGTATFAVRAPANGGLWNGAGYTIWANDQYGRSVITNYRGW